MARPTKVISVLLAVAAVAAVLAGCGTQKISVPKTSSTNSTMTAEIYRGAQLFAQRCAGCHTLSYAGTHGSAENVRDRMSINGPNFNVRCEKPVSRVLYAIENGGFSAAYMPQNIVVGQDARDVAYFVSTYAGRKAPKQPASGKPCYTGKLSTEQSVGTLPPSGSSAIGSIQQADATDTQTTPTSSTTTPTGAGSVDGQDTGASGGPEGTATAPPAGSSASNNTGAPTSGG